MAGSQCLLRCPGAKKSFSTLMSHYEEGLSVPLHLHDDRLEARYHVEVALPPGVSIGQLVVLPTLELLGVLLLDFLVRHAVTRPCKQLVQVVPRPRSHLQPLYSIVVSIPEETNQDKRRQEEDV